MSGAVRRMSGWCPAWCPWMSGRCPRIMSGLSETVRNGVRWCPVHFGHHSVRLCPDCPVVSGSGGVRGSVRRCPEGLSEMSTTHSCTPLDISLHWQGSNLSHFMGHGNYSLTTVLTSVTLTLLRHCKAVHSLDFRQPEPHG